LPICASFRGATITGCLLDDADLSSADLTQAYVKLKRAEWDAYARHLSPWERDNTLDC